VFNRFRIYRETLSRFSCAASPASCQGDIKKSPLLLSPSGSRRLRAAGNQPSATQRQRPPATQAPSPGESKRADTLVLLPNHDHILTRHPTGGENRSVLTSASSLRKASVESKRSAKARQLPQILLARLGVLEVRAEIVTITMTRINSICRAGESTSPEPSRCPAAPQTRATRRRPAADAINSSAR
jgi:hypothetical protein